MSDRDPNLIDAEFRQISPEEIAGPSEAWHRAFLLAKRSKTRIEIHGKVSIVPVNLSTDCVACGHRHPWGICRDRDRWGEVCECDKEIRREVATSKRVWIR